LRSKHNITVDWKIFCFCSLFFLVFSNKALGQVTYRATEDALKQLVKDIESLRKAPLSTSKDSSGRGDLTKGLLGGSYVTKPGDTLNQIIHSQVPDLPLKMNIIRMAVVKANPHAFKRSNPNWMFAGKKLRLPGVEDIRSVVFRTDKNKQKKFSNPDVWIKYP